MIDDATIAGLNEGQVSTARLKFCSSFVYGDAESGHYELGNGLGVILWEEHQAPVFTYQTWFRVGSRHDKASRTGMAHLFEHMMFKATETHAEGVFDRLMEEQGAQTNAATWVDWTYYRQKLPAGCLALVAGLEADRMEKLRVDAVQLASEREVVANERRLRVDNDPDGQLYEAVFALAYQKHPYGVPTIGWMEDIQAITLEDCQDFYRTHYAPNNATIVLVGDFDSRQALETIQSCYGHLDAQVIPADAAIQEPVQRHERRRELSLHVATEKVVFAWHIPPGNHADVAVLELLNEVIAGGDSTWLPRELVTEAELASAVYGWVAAWAYPGLYELVVSLRPGKTLADVESRIDATIARLVNESISERELQKAKNQLEADFVRGLAGVGGRAQGLGDAHTTFGDYRDFFAAIERCMAVSVADVQRVAKDYLGVDNRSVVHLRPLDEEGGVS